MTVGINSAPGSPAELLGDTHPLLEQLGSAEDMAATSTVTDAMELRRVSDLSSLQSFLTIYRAQVLAPLELPAIVAAYQHASRGELKELLALDERLARDPAMQRFAMASCRVGQRQLSKLRPMRDQRLVQRYLLTLENGQARAWHTLVYGVSLAMFSLPLRQGLQHYIEQTMRGFIQSSARTLQLTETVCDRLLDEQSLNLPRDIEAALNLPALQA